MKKLKQKGLMAFWNQWKYIMITFLLAFLPRFIVIFFSMPLRTVTDEMITIAGGAYAAGLDWSAVLSYSERYYGSGFTALFFWIFKLTDNPIIIYRVFQTACVLVQAFTALICFDIMHKTMKIQSQKFVCAASVACSYFVVTRAVIVYNEHILILLTWGLAWLLLKLADYNISKKKKFTYSVLLVGLLLYSLTVHTRAYTYWLSVAIVVVLYAWVYRKLLVSLWAIAAAGIGAVLVNYFLEFFKQGMYLIQEGESLTNTKIYLSGFDYLLSAKSWESWLDIVIGQLNTISIVTGGFIIVGLIIGIRLLWDGIFRRKKFVQLGKQNANLRYYWVICICFGAAVAMTIAAQSMNWLGNVYGEMSGIAPADGYYYKAFTYVRYFGPYCGPIMMVIFAYLFQNRKQSRTYFGYAAALLAALQVYWCGVILPVIYNNRYAVEVFLPFSLNTFTVQPRLRTYLVGSLVLLMMFVILALCNYKKKFVLMASILSVFLIYQYVYNAVVFDAYQSQGNYNDCYEAYNFIRELEDQMDLPSEIYVVDGRDINNQQIFFEYQFLLNRYKIIPARPEAHTDNAVVITNMVLDHMNDYEMIYLSDHAYVYLKGPVLESYQQLQ